MKEHFAIIAAPIDSGPQGVVDHVLIQSRILLIEYLLFQGCRLSETSPAQAVEDINKTIQSFDKITPPIQSSSLCQCLWSFCSKVVSGDKLLPE